MTSPDRIAYDTPGPLTAIDEDLLPDLSGLPDDVLGLCRAAQSLVALPDLATAFGISEERQPEKSIRSVSEIIRVLMAMDPTPLSEPRPDVHRVVGTCRHFAVLSCAFLQVRGIGARTRCGFATYFQPDLYLDHWVVEHWDSAQQRWTRVDSEILGFPFVPNPYDLGPGEFLSGGEAWTLCREGNVDPMQFGVDGTDHAWGIGEVRGNAIRDLAALNQVEMLPWDEWGRMHASYDGETGPEYDDLMDVIAATCASDDSAALRSLYASEDLAVPRVLIT